MNRWGLFVVALVVIAACGAVVLVLEPPRTPLDVALVATSTPSATTTQATSSGQTLASTASSTDNLSDLIVVTSPQPGATVASGSITITGEARGTWYSEAVFPVYLTDESGTVLAQGQAHAQGDWMTSDFVPFVAMLTYTPADSAPARGVLVLKNDNPSGNPSRDKALEIPVVFR